MVGIGSSSRVPELEYRPMLNQPWTLLRSMRCELAKACTLEPIMTRQPEEDSVGCLFLFAVGREGSRNILDYKNSCQQKRERVRNARYTYR